MMSQLMNAEKRDTDIDKVEVCDIENGMLNCAILMPRSLMPPIRYRKGMLKIDDIAKISMAA